MDATQQVRSFNRTVTQRAGALDDEYLAVGRPLGASRVLWEIGAGVSDSRSLAARLELDSRALGRLLRSLERDGLIEVGEHVRLTDAGRAERALLDRRSEEHASSLLAPLNAVQRDRLVEAMALVERLLSAGAVQIAIEDPTSADARFCVESYFAELDMRFEGGFELEATRRVDLGELTGPAGVFFVARLRGEPVGCAALRFPEARSAEIKRMWVAPEARGLGVGRRLLGELERHARARGVEVVRLDTHRALREAQALYHSAGYVEVTPFNDETYAHHWFEKRLS